MELLGTTNFRNRERVTMTPVIPQSMHCNASPKRIDKAVHYRLDNFIMNTIRSILIAFLILFLGSCASQQGIIQKKPAGAKKPPAKTVRVEDRRADRAAKPDSDMMTEPEEDIVPVKIRELRGLLIANGVPGNWFDDQIRQDTFQIHYDIGQYFQKSAEKLIDQDKQYDASWYFARLDVDEKIEKGKAFIEKHSDLLKRAEAKNGIHKELIAAIIGIETNFADRHQRGKFYAFNALVSQYIFTRRSKFAIREITSLYQFAQKTGQPTHYFTSSYAGAIGWGQFIPSSLQSFFIDSNGFNNDIDPFSVEDTIFSVENYLFKHKLSGENIHNDASKYRAVFSYNRSDVYVKAVLYIYEGLRNYFYPKKSG